MGSKGSKPRKSPQHLPKVGSKENMAYKRSARRNEHFGHWPMWIVLIAVVSLTLGILFITL